MPYRWIIAGTILLGLAGSAAAEECIASYYRHGHTTANGERFDPQGPTCAHRKLPFGTIVRVTRLSTGASVTCRINDRGPFKRGRCIDLAQGAAESLNMIRAGVAKVRVDVLN